MRKKDGPYRRTPLNTQQTGVGVIHAVWFINSCIIYFFPRHEIQRKWKTCCRRI